ncbi:putative RuBisCO transcriptional regulator [Saliniradius amylolyticus]|uniref:Putative RuBisCO transcriptional regulator n=1 Tax=Saliniradius amylolyticus TaxID=2183582 RepID=A0A2S2DZF9_9ALTE|nr:LysR family transcriptional regulator [Saliniradius amylolyticus]AWL10739.1 putative RuBisCO transcriptional regulator [Saliniradius amylolyticus]
MEFSLEQLRAFMATVEAGSFSGAARKLGKAQSSISGLIGNLEIDAGFDLFDRSSKTPKLTAEGLALMNDVKAVLKSHRNLCYRVDNLMDHVESEISLAYDDMAIPDSLMLDVAADFEKVFPQTSLMLLQATHKRAYHLIADNRVNVAVVISQDDYPEHFAFRGVAQVQYCTVVGVGHPLAKSESVSTQDLAQHRHLRITDTETGFRRFESDITSNIWYSNSHRAMLDLLQRGLGWAEMPMHIVEPLLEKGQLVRVPTSHQRVTFPHCVDLLWPTEQASGQCLSWLLETLTERGQSLT